MYITCLISYHDWTILDRSESFVSTLVEWQAIAGYYHGIHLFILKTAYLHLIDLLESLATILPQATPETIQHYARLAHGDQTMALTLYMMLEEGERRRKEKRSAGAL